MYSVHYIPGNVESVSLLLARGADVAESSQFGQTALHVAAQRGHTPVIQKLIMAGADPKQKAMNGVAIQAAISYGHIDSVKEFLKHPCDFLSELLSKAVVHEQHEILQMLIKAGVPPDDEPDAVDGALINTPLHISSSKGDLKSTEMLLTAGANVNAVDPIGLTPLLLATRAGQVDVMSVLVENGADVDAKDRTFSRLSACHYAAQIGLMKCLKCLLFSGAAINSIDRDHCTPLFRAVTMHQEATSIVLIKENCDVNMKGNLLSFTINLGHQDTSVTPLEKAHALKLYSLAKFLILAGTKPSHVCALADDIHTRLNILKTSEDGDFLEWINRNKVRSLQHACRLRIRQAIGSPATLKLKGLPLPGRMLDYLMYPEVQVPAECEDKPSESEVADSLAYYMPARWLNPDAYIYAGD